MTPAQYLAVGRDIVILAAIGIILWLVYRGGQDHVKAADLKALQTQIEQQAKTLQTWRKESTDANDQLSKDVAAINAAPVVVHDWVRNDSCPKPTVLPATPAPAGRSAPSAGGPEPGPGDAARADRRDFAVQEFKRKYETAFAECRAVLTQWPSP